MYKFETYQPSRETNKDYCSYFSSLFIQYYFLFIFLQQIFWFNFNPPSGNSLIKFSLVNPSAQRKASQDAENLKYLGTKCYQVE